MKLDTFRMLLKKEAKDWVFNEDAVNEGTEEFTYSNGNYEVRLYLPSGEGKEITIATGDFFNSAPVIIRSFPVEDLYITVGTVWDDATSKAHYYWTIRLLEEINIPLREVTKSENLSMNITSNYTLQKYNYYYDNWGEQYYFYVSKDLKVIESEFLKNVEINALKKKIASLEKEVAELKEEMENKQPKFPFISTGYDIAYNPEDWKKTVTCTTDRSFTE
jgi:hypothetical protein